jgi:hypothetical protein
MGIDRIQTIHEGLVSLTFLCRCNHYYISGGGAKNIAGESREEVAVAGCQFKQCSHVFLLNQSIIDEL